MPHVSLITLRPALLLISFVFFYFSSVFASYPYSEQPYYQQPYPQQTIAQPDPWTEAQPPPSTPPPVAPVESIPFETSATSPASTLPPHLDMEGVYHGPFSIYYSQYFYVGAGYSLYTDSTNNYSLTYNNYYTLFAEGLTHNALPLTAGMLLYNNGPHQFRVESTFSFYFKPSTKPNTGYLQRGLSVDMAYGYFVYNNIMLGTSGGLGTSRSHVHIDELGGIAVNYTSVQTNMFMSLSLFVEFIYGRNGIGIAYRWNGVPFVVVMKQNAVDVSASAAPGSQLISFYYRFFI